LSARPSTATPPRSRRYSPAHTNTCGASPTCSAQRPRMEEATQEALIVLFRKIGTLRATAALASWMFQIVRNECVRRSRIALHRQPSTTAVEPSAEDAALAHLEMEQVVDSIAKLPPDQRAVLVLRDVQGLSGSATARELGLSRAAMKSRLHRGREAVRSGLRTPMYATSGGGSTNPGQHQTEDKE
jgi:RNA polymerase sigma factor (sigma-70 family)